MNRRSKSDIPRRPINLTIRQDIIQDARRYDINISKEAEKSIARAVIEAKQKRWLKENARAIKAHNQRVQRDGLLITAHWMDE